MFNFGVDEGTCGLMEGMLAKDSGVVVEANGVAGPLEAGKKHLKDILTRCFLMF